MIYENKKVSDIKIAYIGGGSRGWAWTLMKDLAKADDISGTVALYDIDFAAAKDIRTAHGTQELYDVLKNTVRELMFLGEDKSPIINMVNNIYSEKEEQ